MKINNENFISELKRKNEKALEFIVKNYGGLMNAAIHRILYSYPEDAEECLYDAILKIWNHIDSFDENKSSFSNWATAVAKYSALDSLRKLTKSEPLLDIDEIQIFDKNYFTGNEMFNEFFLELISCLNEEDKKYSYVCFGMVKLMMRFHINLKETKKLYSIMFQEAEKKSLQTIPAYLRKGENMNKDIYSILNNTRNEDAECERLSDMEVNNIMKRFNENKEIKTTSRKIRKFAVGSAAVAVCLTAFLIPVMSHSNIITNKNNSIADNSDVQKNSFFISVDAAEIEPNKAFGISMADSGGGEFPFSGRTFFINGTNIKNVSLSIDKGQLYKSSYESSYPIEEDLKPDKSYAECCEYIGNEYTGAFDQSISYGLYLSEEIFESEYSEDNFKKSWYACFDEFNDAVLNISVEYEDGQKENIGYALKSGMLEIDKETMKPNGNFSDGSTPYIYGLYFEPQTD